MIRGRCPLPICRGRREIPYHAFCERHWARLPLSVREDLYQRAHTYGETQAAFRQPLQDAAAEALRALVSDACDCAHAAASCGEQVCEHCRAVEYLNGSRP